MHKSRLSVFFVTLNEAATIQQAIEAVSEFDEIIVVDSGSTDGTVEIAEKAGARVIHQQWLGFAKQKSFAMNLCKNEWVFNLDGDEIVTPDVITEIKALIEADSCDGIRVNFEDVFMGRPMHPQSHKRSIVRVFKKSKARYPTDRLVHENVILEGKVSRIKSNILHYGYQSAADFMAKQNTYSTLGARQKKIKGKKHSLLKLLLIFPIAFIKAYFLHKMFLSGWRGFIHAMIEAMYSFLKEAKLYEQYKTTDKA
ncbi:glycosyltransferase family 2 protein [Catenovulum sediminis]|uniref:Glycosyltransferase family 2 protein n=1 Tax=Catenovulum sediminis TaxID=1740262 RepID=A0ABV1RGJ3_9ALTE|nr:glycosyltransferase family 2 protein [Catenovulum sediminis]